MANENIMDISFDCYIAIDFPDEKSSSLLSYQTMKYKFNCNSLVKFIHFMVWYDNNEEYHVEKQSNFPLQLSTACNSIPAVKNNIPYHCHAGEEYAQCCRRVRRGVCGMGERSERQCVALSWHFSVSALCVKMINVNIRPFILFHIRNFHILRQKSRYSA